MSLVSTTIIDINNTTHLAAVFEVDANVIVAEHTVFNDNIEKENEERKCAKFPIGIGVLQKIFSKSFYKLTWRHK